MTLCDKILEVTIKHRGSGKLKQEYINCFNEFHSYQNYLIPKYNGVLNYVCSLEREYFEDYDLLSKLNPITPYNYKNSFEPKLEVLKDIIPITNHKILYPANQIPNYALSFIIPCALLAADSLLGNNLGAINYAATGFTAFMLMYMANNYHYFRSRDLFTNWKMDASIVDISYNLVKK